MTPAAALIPDPRRRQAVIASPLNGIDFADILDADAPNASSRQRLLRVAFLKPPAAGLQPANFAISGGDRITGISVDQVNPDSATTLLLHLTARGDFSPYWLTIQAAPGSSFDPSTFDPLFTTARFFFKAECPSDFDCQPAEAATAPLLPPPPQLDYLAKDYTSFRAVMLDRISSLAPDWRERNAADLGVTLVELFAHVGDLLSYRQDAVVAEAYLGMARRRVSVRRHARLVDYFPHEGVNARVFLHAEVSADLTLPAGSQAFTRLPGQAPRIVPGSADLNRAMTMAPRVFETVHDAPLFTAHNEIAFYTWGDPDFRLPTGATSATLAGQFPNLKAGDILIFEEALGPLTGAPGDADPTHRYAVRLTSVTAGTDPIGAAFASPPGAGAAAVTNITWPADDATPFALRVSGQILSSGGAKQLDRISVARGNVVLADHGAPASAEQNEGVGAVPQPSLFRPPPMTDGFPAGAPTPLLPRFRPRLKSGPLVHAAPYDKNNPPASARATLATSPADALPMIKLSGFADGQPPVDWTVRRDLLASGPEAMDFVAEVESDGFAWLRFGDNTNGRRPAPGTTFTAKYRVGDPAAGNVAADSIAHVVSADSGVTRVRNPLPAVGGVAPESMEHARATAPFAFRTQQRAVTAADYEAAAQQHPEVQRAAATFRWTGSWHTIFLTIDRRGGLPVDDAFRATMLGFLEPFRLAGHDLAVDGPVYVPIDIALSVAAKPDHFNADVKQALLAAFGTGAAPDGRPRVFNPDNFTFGQPVYLSAIYATAQAVDGVAAARVTKFQRRDQPGGDGLSRGELDFARLEIAQLNNDPDFPERGVFQVFVRGGK